MSRGGMGRGGRGGGRGRGRGGGTDLLSSTGQFSYDEIRSGMNSKSQSSIYPIPPSHAITPVPQVSELRAATAQLALLQEMKLGPFWPGMQDDPHNAAASTSASTTTTTTTERKSGLELPRYSDRYKPKALNASSSHGSSSAANGPSLTSLILQREVFPQILWKSYMQGEERREALRVAKATSKKRARVDWDSFERGGASKAVGAGATAGAGGDGDEDADEDKDKDEEEELDAYEDDEDEGDYAAEDYFDDGDGDDEDALDSYARGARGGGNADGEYD